MEYEVVKKWLDELVKDFNASTQKRCLSTSIYAAINTDMWILVYDGIDIIADVMNLELTKEDCSNEDYFCYSFIYQDTRFVGYIRKEV